MNKCYIFGALDIDVKTLKLNIEDSDLVIAADKGLLTVIKLGIEPDFIIGDFDSLKETPIGENVIKHPIIKDDTDSLLCVKKGFECGYQHFEFYGCLGKRIDHTLANIQTATFIAENGGTSIFYDTDNDTALTVIKNNSIEFSENCNGKISIFSLSDKSTEVNISGLFYELDNTHLSSTFPLGVSNEFNNKKAVINVGNGTLCIIWDNVNGNYKIGG